MTVTESMLRAIGNTPLVQLNKVVDDGCARVLVKVEAYNPTGSYKDRMALAIVEGAERRGDLRPGMRVVEFSGGSTASSLAFVCAVKGYPLHIISSDAFAREKLDTVRAFGADVTVVPSEGQGITADLIARMRALAEQAAAADDVYWTNQFHNTDAFNGYAHLAEEVLRDLDGAPDTFCGGVGTAGMLMGVARTLRESAPPCRIAAVEPASSAILSRGQSGAHRIEGVGVGFVPPMVDRAVYDRVIAVDEAEARSMARRLAREEGLFTGTSSGMNVCAALQLARELGPGRTVVTVAVDSGLKYLSGDLFVTRNA